MKNKKRILAACMAALMTMTTIPMSAFAAEDNTPKEEVVYINLNTDGSVKEINVVNIFDLDEKGTIVDYGEYESIRNMTTTDEITYANDRVSVEAEAGKLYYEGKLTDTQMPWKINIHYYLDGAKYDAKELAGKNGRLKITMDITENTACAGTFFEDYALQASVTLDTKKCSNIKADGATIANVGADKQLTYTILPGEGASVEIIADVTEFEMASIAINGIPLSMDIEVDDEELMDQVSELLEAIAKLDDGAGELKTGIETLNSGAKELNSGISQIQAGLNELNAKSPELIAGSKEVNEVLVEIQTGLSGVTASKGQIEALVNGSDEVNSGIALLTEGIATLQNSVSYDAYKAVMAQNELNIDIVQTANVQTIDSLNEQIAALNEQISYLEANEGDSTQIETLRANLVQLQQIATLLQANSAAISGMNEYLTQVNSSIGELADGAVALKENYASLNEGINVLAEELENMLVNMSTLKNGIDTLVTEYEKLDSGINDYTSGVAQIVAGYSEVSKGSAELVSGTKELQDGSSSLYAGTKELLSGICEIYDATGTLKDGTGELNDGVAELIAGIIELYDGTVEMKDGTTEFREETDGMDTEISDKIDEMLESFTGDIEIKSFVSEKNTNVDAVQFVIQTESIEIEKAEEVTVEAEETLSFWEKFLALFRLK